MSQVLQNAYKEDEGEPGWIRPDGAPEGIWRRDNARPLPEGISWYPEEDGRCRVIRPDGQRCAAARMRGRGICAGHAGIGGVALDPLGQSKKGNAAKLARRERRQLLAIGPRRMANPRQVARLRAMEEAEEIAAALIEPVHDARLTALERQSAAVVVLDQVDPLATVSAHVQLPGTPEEAERMGWGAMRALAASLGSSTDVADPPPSRMDTAIEG